VDDAGLDGIYDLQAPVYHDPDVSAPGAKPAHYGDVVTALQGIGLVTS